MKYSQLRTLEVSKIGFSLKNFDDNSNMTEEEKIGMIRSAYEDYGCTLFDIPCDPINEEIFGKAVKSFRSEIILCAKFTPQIFQTPNFRDNLELTLKNSLKRLQTDYIDIYYQHANPSEDRRLNYTAELIEILFVEGNIRGWGISGALDKVKRIRRANSIMPITAIQTEYSILNKSINNRLIALCQELGIGIVAVSNSYAETLEFMKKRVMDLENQDESSIKFKDTILKNYDMLSNRVIEIANEKSATPDQISFAWLMSKSENIVPVSIVNNQKQLKEIFDSTKVELNEEEFNELDGISIKLERKSTPFDIDSNIIELEVDGKNYICRLIFTDHGTKRYFERKVIQEKVLNSLKRAWNGLLEDADDKKSISYICDRKNSIAVVCNLYWSLNKDKLTLILITIIVSNDPTISKKRMGTCHVHEI